MIKRITCWLLIIVLALPLAGCWSRKELTELAIVLAAGVDLAPDGNIILTVQIARANAFGGGSGQRMAVAQENTTWVVSQKAETVLDAQRYLEAKVSRKLYWGHTVILVFGEQMAREGLRKAMNYFSRAPGPRETIWVLVTKGKAENVLKSHSQLENTSAQSVGRMIRSGAGAQVMLKDLSMILASKGINPVLPRIELTPSGQPQGPGMAENIPQAKARNQPQPGTQNHAEVTMTGTGVFDDERLVGWLNYSETRGLLWLKDQIKNGEITINSPAEPGKHISVNVTSGDTSIEPFYDGQNLWFDVKIKLEGDLWEQQSTETLTDPRISSAIEKACARKVALRTRSALEKAQDVYGVDIFGFGEAFHRKYKKDWAVLKDNWNEVFASARVNVAVEARIKRTGLVTNRISKE